MLPLKPLRDAVNVVGHMLPFHLLGFVWLPPPMPKPGLNKVTSRPRQVGPKHPVPAPFHQTILALLYREGLRHNRTRRQTMKWKGPRWKAHPFAPTSPRPNNHLERSSNGAWGSQR